MPSHTHDTHVCAHGHTRTRTQTHTHMHRHTRTCTWTHTHVHTQTHARAGTHACTWTHTHFLVAPCATCYHTFTQPHSHSLTHLNAPLHRYTLAHTHANSYQTPREQPPGPSPAAPGPGGWQATQLPPQSRRRDLAGKRHQTLAGRLTRFFRGLPDFVPWTLPTGRPQTPSLRGPLPGVSDPLAATQSWPWRMGVDCEWGRGVLLGL